MVLVYRETAARPKIVVERYRVWMGAVGGPTFQRVNEKTHHVDLIPLKHVPRRPRWRTTSGQRRRDVGIACYKRVMVGWVLPCMVTSVDTTP